ncbi:FAD binding domain-containing protein [Thermodesulfobacteriota bacterium]
MRFEYFDPHDIGEATSFLAKAGESARPLAGGTDLIPRIRDRLDTPRYVVNIKGLSELNGMGREGDGWRIGALTTIRMLETSSAIRLAYPILNQAAAELGSVQVRNIATVGGNLCHAVPSADMAPPLLCLDAKVSLIGHNGKRSLPLQDFFLEPRRTAIQPGELLSEISLPILRGKWGGLYLKLGHRKAMDLAVVGVAIWVALDSLERILDCRIALGSVAPTPVRARRAEELLKGEKVTEALLDKAAETAMDECQPIDDIRATARYRRHMIRMLTRRGLRQSLTLARRTTTYEA